MAERTAKPKRTTRGEIHPKRTMFLRCHVGDARSGNTAYEMSTNASCMNPIIQSKQTGKWFTLSWQDIIELAVEAGIDAET